MNDFAGDPFSPNSILNEAVENTDVEEAIRPNEIVLGRIMQAESASQPVVAYRIGLQNYQHTAITTQPLSADSKGRQVALAFINGDFQKPIVLGVVRNSLDDAIENFSSVSQQPADDLFADTLFEEAVSAEQHSELDAVTVDGQRVHIEGKEEIVLKCGSASITLTKSGKIVLRGKYLVSRSSGVNRILGGSVQVN